MLNNKLVALAITLILLVAIVVFDAGKPPQWYGSPILRSPSPSPTNLVKDPPPAIGCTKTQEYANREEFKRAISLVIQRLGEGNTAWGSKYAKDFQRIRTCLDIQYVQSEGEINDAEGLFSFSVRSTPNRLQILVSPRYKVKDDLLTAILLSHEMTHALVFADGATSGISCFDNEALAFTTEMMFIGTLNDDEVASLTYRSNHGYPEARGVIDLIVATHGLKGTSPFEKMQNYVRSNNFYQKQCGMAS